MAFPGVPPADKFLEGPTLIKNPFGPKLNYGHTGRSWADNHYVPVQPLPGDLTKEKKPARSKAVCLPCSANSPELRYLYSTSDDIQKHGRQHMNDIHSELKRLDDRDVPTSQLTSGIADEVLVVLKTRYGMSYMSLEDPLIDFLLGSLAASHATRKTLSSTVIASVHTRLAQFISAEISSASFVTIAVDSWSSLKAKRKYLGLHCFMHHEARDTPRSELFLEFSYSAESETSAYLQKRIKEIIDQNNIEVERIVALVTDRGSNIRNVHKALRLLGVHCSAHGCHNAVTASLKSLKCVIALVKDIRTIIACFNRSTAASAKLESIQIEDAQDPKRVISYADTRWDSFFEACFRLLELGDHIIEATRAQVIKSVGIDNPHLRLLFVMLRLLKPVKEFVDKLINRSNSEPIDIFSTLRSAVHLFVSVSDLVLHAIQSFWKKSGETLRTYVNLDEDATADNVGGLSAAFSVLLLQFLRRYLFSLLQKQLSEDSSNISLLCVGASLDDQWKDALRLTSVTSNMARILASSSRFPKIQSLNKVFVQQIVRCKNKAGYKDFSEVLRVRLDSGSPFHAPILADFDRLQADYNDSDVIDDDEDVDADEDHQLSDFATAAEQALDEDDSELGPDAEFEYHDNDTFSPLVKEFHVVDVEDMLTIIIKQYATFVDDIISLDSQFEIQLRKFAEHLNILNRLPSLQSDDASSECSDAEDFDDQWLRFTTSNRRTHRDPSLSAHLRSHRDPVTQKNMEDTQFWSALRLLSHTRTHSSWLFGAIDSNDTFAITRLLHRALSTVPATSVAIERDFSTATQLQSDLRMQLDPDLFGKEVYISRNYALLQFAKFAKIMSWLDSPDHRQAELRRQLLEALPESGPQPTQNATHAASPLPMSPLTVSRRSSILSPTPILSPASSFITARPNIIAQSMWRTSSQQPTPTLSSRPSVHRPNPNETLDALQARAFDDVNFTLGNASSRDCATNGNDKEQAAIDGMRALSKKRRAETAVAPVDSLLSFRRQAIISRLTQPNITLDLWKQMIEDDRCGLHDSKKFLLSLWTFASSRNLVNDLVAKMTSVMRTADQDLTQELSRWRAGAQTQSMSNGRSASSASTAVPIHISPSLVTNLLSSEIIDLTDDPVASRFQQLPGVRFKIGQFGSVRAQLAANGLTSHDAGGGGDCLFLSTAYMMNTAPSEAQEKLRKILNLEDRTSFDHLALRALSVDHISRNWNTYKDARYEPTMKRMPGKDAWLKKLGTPGTWGDHLSVQAMANELRLEFLILRNEESEIMVAPTAEVAVHFITLTLKDEQHYQAVKLLPRAKRKYGP